MNPMNLYVHEHLVTTHCQDMQREAEQYRLAASLSHKRGSVALHAIGMLGRLLITVGTRMKQIEVQSREAKAV